MTTPQLPEVLYHYCPSAALPEILRSGVLWLTHQSGLNDLREAVWVVPFIRNAIRRRQTEATKGFFFQLMELFELNSSEGIYVAGFSSDGDMLSQWRAYAMDGDGFAIGFRPKAFCAELRIPMTSYVADHTVGFLKVQYDNKMLKQMIETILDDFLSGLQESGNPLTYFLRLRALALSFKNPAFKEEDEWRISYSPMIHSIQGRHGLEVTGMLSEMRFRTSRYGVLPYFEIPFDKPDREDAIVEVVIGPKNPSIEGLVEMLLLSLGYHSASVRRSSASYR